MTSLLHALAPCIPTVRDEPRPAPISTSLQLPNELWVEIFVMLDTNDLLRVSVVNRTFNALAIPLYLGRFGVKQAAVRVGELDIPTHHRHLPGILRLAFFLPPITSLRCAISIQQRYDTLHHFTSFFASSRLSRDHIAIEFHSEHAFMARDSRFRLVTTVTMQRAVRDLLNASMPTKRALVVFGDTGRSMLLDPTPPGLRRWRLVKHPPNPPHSGLRPRLRHALHIRRPALERVLTLFASFTSENGTTTRTSEGIDELWSVDVTYNLGDGLAPWSLVVLNGSRSRTFRMPTSIRNIVAVGSLSWADLLPRMSFPALKELHITSGTPFSSTDSRGIQLHEVSVEAFDEFLVRHPTINKLDYLPDFGVSLADSPAPGFAFVTLTHLTTTAAYFIRSFQSPTCLRSLAELRLLDDIAHPAKTETMVALMHILAANKPDDAFRMSLPASWPPLIFAADLQVDPISCVGQLHLFDVQQPEDVPIFLRHLVNFVSLFEPATLRGVELQAPSSNTTSTFCRNTADTLRMRAPWLEDVVCVRVSALVSPFARKPSGKPGEQRKRRVFRLRTPKPVVWRSEQWVPVDEDDKGT
ncbi:F-box domain-containing protein [Mycena indigotica]|uniref:F-box domain-containing protein n=1 Tax=Mycena indigotica TaxID=2126181 RepID=A0A8H6VRM3_9AGAR|nr:F-box domain-containing protein [Mycena indigotica]KAF7291269.1 F-box domain-containing protein [Mycena indigotica]